VSARLPGSTKVITAVSASFSRASWSETRVERECLAHEFPGADPATPMAESLATQLGEAD
jgi:hypothetical protein